jgi:hypothetical protein
MRMLAARMDQSLTTGAPSRGRFARLADLVVERANPMLVRIVRQDLRNKAFTSVFVILLAAAVIMAVIIASFADQGKEGSAGTLFGVLAWAWTFALGLVQPMGSFRAVSQERNEDTWDLVELTGMRPRQVLTGLMLASMVQGILYTSALAPFMVMAYLLRGLELTIILFALVMVPIWGSAASALGVFCACLGNSKAARALLGALLGLGLCGLWMMSASVWFRVGYELAYFVNALIAGNSEKWIVVAAVINAWLAFLVLMIVLSGTLLTFRAGNRSTAPRLAWYALWVNLLLWMASLPLLPHGPELSQSLTAFAIPGVVAAAVLGLFSISEDHELSPRQARAITERKGLGRAAMLLFGPGAARGRLAYLALALGSLVIGTLGWMTSDPTSTFVTSGLVGKWLLSAWLLLCYFNLYFVIADRLYRGRFATWFPTPPLRRGFTLLVFGIAMLAPVLALAIIDTDLIHTSSFTVLSPAMGLAVILESPSQWAVSVVAVSSAGVISTLALLRQGLNLRIVTHRVVASDGDKNPRSG